MLSYQRNRKPLSESALRQLVTSAVEKEWVREAFHSEHERSHRNISYEDILYGLERSDWSLAAPPDFDDTHKNWEYEIKTVDIEGVELHLKIAPRVDDGTVLVITKY
jgi:hypothetical protein